jgi:hypothetical protein
MAVRNEPEKKNPFRKLRKEDSDEDIETLK